jgi:hypothetical protein
MNIIEIFERSDSQLIAIAKKIGTKLFGKSHSGLVFNDSVRHMSYDDYVSESGDDFEGEIGTYEYVFFPSTGKGLDCSDQKISKEMVDADGKIYIGGSDGVKVISDPFKSSMSTKKFPTEMVERFKKEVFKHFKDAKIDDKDEFGQIFAYDSKGKMIGQFIEKKTFGKNVGQPGWLVFDGENTLANENWY